MKRCLLLALGCAALLTLPSTAEAQWRMRRVVPNRVVSNRFPPNRMPGWDWRRIYPWSPYNYGRNPYNPIVVPYVNNYPYYAPYYPPYAGPVNYGTPYVGTNMVTSGYTPQQPSANTQDPLPEVSGPVTTPPAGGAIIRLTLPDAFGQVYFDDVQTQSIGTTRYYVTPPLPGGKNLAYTVRAVFNRNGQTVTEERRLLVAPGRTSVVNFGS